MFFGWNVRRAVSFHPFIGFFEPDGHPAFDDRPDNLNEILDKDAALIPQTILVLRKLARMRFDIPRPGKIGRNDPSPADQVQNTSAAAPETDPSTHPADALNPPLRNKPRRTDLKVFVRRIKSAVKRAVGTSVISRTSGVRDQTRRKRMTSVSTPAAEIASNDVWKAARRLNLYGRTDIELDALIVQHHEDTLPADRVIAEAARYIGGLRRALAIGPGY